MKVLSIEIGARRPLGIGVSGLVLLASLSETEAVEVVGRNAHRLDAHQIDPVGLLAGLVQTRKQGYAYAPTGVVPGSRALAVPIRLLDGKTVAGLAIATITERLPKDRVQTIVRHLTERAELIGTQLQELTRRKNERSS